MRFPGEFESETETETRAIARAFAQELYPGDIVALSGGLGSGKTVFVRGLAEGLGGDPEGVASPTFALMHEYGCSRAAAFVHLDLYRIADDERELREIGLPDLLDGKIAAVEWPNRSAERLLRFRYRVSFETLGSSGRRIRVERDGGAAA